jgi:hypothetical protein
MLYNESKHDIFALVGKAKTKRAHHSLLRAFQQYQKQTEEVGRGERRW